MEEDTNQPLTPLGNERRSNPGQTNIMRNSDGESIVPTTPSWTEDTSLEDIAKQYTGIGGKYNDLVENAADNVGDRQVQLVGNDFGATNPYMFNTYYEPAATAFASEMRQQGTQKAVEVGLERAEEEARKRAAAAQDRYNKALSAAKEREEAAKNAKIHVSETDMSKMPKGTNEKEVLASAAFDKMSAEDRKNALESARIKDMQLAYDYQNLGIKDWNVKDWRKDATANTKAKFPELFSNWENKTQAEKDAVWARQDVGNYWTEQYMLKDFQSRGKDAGEEMAKQFTNIHNDVNAIVQAFIDNTVDKLSSDVFNTSYYMASAPISDQLEAKEKFYKNIHGDDATAKQQFDIAYNDIKNNRVTQRDDGKWVRVDKNGNATTIAAPEHFSYMNGYKYNLYDVAKKLSDSGAYEKFANGEYSDLPMLDGFSNEDKRSEKQKLPMHVTGDATINERLTDAFGFDYDSYDALAKLKVDNPEDYEYLLNQAAWVTTSSGTPFDTVSDPDKKYFINGQWYSANDENSPIAVGDLVFYSVDGTIDADGNYTDENLKRFIDLYHDIYTGSKEATDENVEALNKYYQSYQTVLSAAMAQTSRYGMQVSKDIYASCLAQMDGADTSKLMIVNPSDPSKEISMDELEKWFNSFSEDEQYNGYTKLAEKASEIRGYYYVYGKNGALSKVKTKQNGISTIGKYGKNSDSANMEMSNQVDKLSSEQSLAILTYLDYKLKKGDIKADFFDNDEVQGWDVFWNQTWATMRRGVTDAIALGKQTFGVVFNDKQSRIDANKMWDEANTLDRFDNMNPFGDSSRTDHVLFNEYTEDVRKMQRSNLNHMVTTEFNINYFDPNNKYDEATGEIKDKDGKVIAYTDNTYFHKDDLKGLQDVVMGMGGFILGNAWLTAATHGVGTIAKYTSAAIAPTKFGQAVSAFKGSLTSVLTRPIYMKQIGRAHSVRQAQKFVNESTKFMRSPMSMKLLVDSSGKTVGNEAFQEVFAEAMHGLQGQVDDATRYVISNYADDLAVGSKNMLPNSMKTATDGGRGFISYLDENGKYVFQSSDDVARSFSKADDALVNLEAGIARGESDDIIRGISDGLDEASDIFKGQYAADKVLDAVVDNADDVTRQMSNQLTRYMDDIVKKMSPEGQAMAKKLFDMVDDISYESLRTVARNTSLSEATGISIERIAALDDDIADVLYGVLRSSRGSEIYQTGDIFEYMRLRNVYNAGGDVANGTINFQKAALDVVEASEKAAKAKGSLSVADSLRYIAKNSTNQGALISALKRSAFIKERVKDYALDIYRGYQPELDENFNSRYTSIDDYMKDPNQWVMGAIFDGVMHYGGKAMKSLRLVGINHKMDKLVSQVSLAHGVENDSVKLTKNLRKLNSLSLQADKLSNDILNGKIDYTAARNTADNINNVINAHLDEVTDHFDPEKTLKFMENNITQAGKSTNALDRIKDFTRHGRSKLVEAEDLNRTLIRSNDKLQSFISNYNAIQSKGVTRFALMLESTPNLQKFTSKQYMEAWIRAWDKIKAHNYADTFTDLGLPPKQLSNYMKNDSIISELIKAGDKESAKKILSAGYDVVWDAFYDELKSMESSLGGAINFRAAKAEMNYLKELMKNAAYEMIDDGQSVRINYFPLQGLFFNADSSTPVALTGFFYGAGQHTTLSNDMLNPLKQRDTYDMDDVVESLKRGDMEYKRKLSRNESLRAQRDGLNTEYEVTPYNQDGFNPIYAVQAYLNAYDSHKYATDWINPIKFGNTVIASNDVLNEHMMTETAMKESALAQYRSNLEKGYNKLNTVQITPEVINARVRQARDIINGRDIKEIAKNNVKISRQKSILRKTIVNSDQFTAIKKYIDIENPTDAQIAARINEDFDIIAKDIRAAREGSLGNYSELYDNPNAVSYRNAINEVAKNKSAVKDLELVGIGKQFATEEGGNVYAPKYAPRTIDVDGVELYYDAFNKRYYSLIGLAEQSKADIEYINSVKKSDFSSTALTKKEGKALNKWTTAQEKAFSKMDNVYDLVDDTASTFEASTAGHKEFSALNAKFAKGTKIMGVDIGGHTIEDVYQKTLKGSGKNQAPSADSVLGKATAEAEKKAGRALTKAEKEAISQHYYDRLWDIWGEQNPKLKAQIENLPAGTKITDKFAKTGVSQANSLQRWVKPVQAEANVQGMSSVDLKDSFYVELNRHQRKPRYDDKTISALVDKYQDKIAKAQTADEITNISDEIAADLVPLDPSIKNSATEMGHVSSDIQNAIFWARQGASSAAPQAAVADAMEKTLKRVPRYDLSDIVSVREVNDTTKADITSIIYNMMADKFGDRVNKEGAKTFSSSVMRRNINQFAYDAYDLVALNKTFGEGISAAEVIEEFNWMFPDADVFTDENFAKAFTGLTSKLVSFKNSGGELTDLATDIEDTLRRVYKGEIKMAPEMQRKFANVYYDLYKAMDSSSRVTNHSGSELSLDTTAKTTPEGETITHGDLRRSNASYSRSDYTMRSYAREADAEDAMMAEARKGGLSLDADVSRTSKTVIQDFNEVLDFMGKRKTQYKTRLNASKKAWDTFNSDIYPNYKTVVDNINAAVEKANKSLPDGKKIRPIKVASIDGSPLKGTSDSNWLRVVRQYEDGVDRIEIGKKVYTNAEVGKFIDNGIDGKGAIKNMNPARLEKFVQDNNIQLNKPAQQALDNLKAVYDDFANGFLDDNYRPKVKAEELSADAAIMNLLSQNADAGKRPLNFDASKLAIYDIDNTGPKIKNDKVFRFNNNNGEVVEVRAVADYGTGSAGTRGTATYWYEVTEPNGNIVKFDNEEQLAASLKGVTANDIDYIMNSAGVSRPTGERYKVNYLPDGTKEMVEGEATDYFYRGNSKNMPRGIDRVGPDYDDWQISYDDTIPDDKRLRMLRYQDRQRTTSLGDYSSLKSYSKGTDPTADFIANTVDKNMSQSAADINNVLYGKDGKPGYIDNMKQLVDDNGKKRLKMATDYYHAVDGLVSGLSDIKSDPRLKKSVMDALESIKAQFAAEHPEMADDINDLIDETMYQLSKSYDTREELVNAMIEANPTYKAMKENIDMVKGLKAGDGKVIVNMSPNGVMTVSEGADMSGRISVAELRKAHELVAMEKNGNKIIRDIKNRHTEKKILKEMRDNFNDGYVKKQKISEATFDSQNKWIDNLMDVIRQETGVTEIDESKVFIDRNVASLGQCFFGEGTAGWQERAYSLMSAVSSFNKTMQDFHLAGGIGQYNAFTLRNALTMMWQNPISGTKALYTNFKNAQSNTSVRRFLLDNSDMLMKYAMDSGDYSAINKFATVLNLRDEVGGGTFFTNTTKSIMDLPTKIAENQNKLAGFWHGLGDTYKEMFNNPTFTRWTTIANADLTLRNYKAATKYVERMVRRYGLTDADFATMDGGRWGSKDQYIATLARLRTDMYWKPQDFVKTKFNAKKYLDIEEAKNKKMTIESLRSMPKKTTAGDAFRNFFFAVNYKLQMNMHPINGFGSLAATVINAPRANAQLASRSSAVLAASRFASRGNRNEAVVLLGIAALAHAWNTAIGAPSAWSELWNDQDKEGKTLYTGISQSLMNFQDFFKIWLPSGDTGRFSPEKSYALDPAFSIFTLQNSGAKAMNALIDPKQAHVGWQRNDFGFQNAYIGDWNFGRGIEGFADELIGANLLAGYKAAYEVFTNNTYFGNNIWEQPYMPDGTVNPNYDPGRNFMASIAHILNLDGALEGNGLTGSGSNRWVKGLNIDSIEWEHGHQLETPKTKGLKIGKAGKWQDKTGTVSGSGLLQHEYTTALQAINDGDYFEALSGAMELPFKSRSYVARARTSLNQEVALALRDAKREYDAKVAGTNDIEAKNKAFALFAKKSVDIVHEWSHRYGDVLGSNDELTATATKILMAFMSDEYNDSTMYMQNMYSKLRQELKMADGDQFLYSKERMQEAIAAGMDPTEAAETFNKHLTAMKEAQMREYKARVALEEAGINDGLSTSVFDTNDFLYDKMKAKDATISKQIYTEIKGKLESPIGEFKNFEDMKKYYESLIEEASTTKQKAKLAEKYNAYVTDVISPYVNDYGAAVFNNAYWDGDNVSNHFGKYIIIPADKYYSGKSPRSNYLRDLLHIGWRDNSALPSDKEIKEGLNKVAIALSTGKIVSANSIIGRMLSMYAQGKVHISKPDYDKLIRMRALMSSRSR